MSKNKIVDWIFWIFLSVIFSLVLFGWFDFSVLDLGIK